MVLNKQNQQTVVEPRLVRYPPVQEMYRSTYCKQVIPAGGLMVMYLMSEQLISCLLAAEFHVKLSKLLSGYHYPSLPLPGTCMEKGNTSASTIQVGCMAATHHYCCQPH